MMPEINAEALGEIEREFLLRGGDGSSPEDVEGMLRRVSDAAAASETRYGTSADRKQAADMFYELMVSGRFWPDEAALRCAGRPDAALSACFVLPVEDSMEGIFTAVKNAALVRKCGGGVGFSLSRLRPEGASVGTSGGAASGPVGFLGVFGMAAESVRAEGAGAAGLGVLRADHPDILAFLNGGKGAAGLRLAAGLTDDFLRAAREDGTYDLVDPHTGRAVRAQSAREVLAALGGAMLAGRVSAAVFLDRVNRDNPLPIQGDIEAVDPRGGQPLLPNESCVLGSVCLAPMARGGEVDYALLRRTVHDAVRFLDDLVDANRAPLEEIGRTTRASRRVGLGVSGFADLLAALGLEYGGGEAVELAAAVMQFVNTEAHAASTALAAARGSFPLYVESLYQHGAPMRNATVTAIAPSRAARLLGGAAPGVGPLPGASAAPEAVVRVQAAFQKYTDGAVFEPAALPPDATRESVEALILLAESLGCKTLCLVPPERPEAPAPPRTRSGESAGETAGTPPDIDGEPPRTAPEKTGEDERRTDADGRGAVAAGFTERLRTGCGEIRVTVSYGEGGVFEVLAGTHGSGGCAAQTEAAARLATLALRAGASGHDVAAALRGIRCAASLRRADACCASCADAIGRVVEKVDRYARAGADAEPPRPEPPLRRRAPRPAGPRCPDCGAQLERRDARAVCPACGWSRSL